MGRLTISQIIGAPAFFPTVWGWIKRWFDPITVSKIFILSSANVFPTLSQYIDPDNIPKKYGGNLDFEWGSMPVLEPEIESQIKWENPDVQNGRNTVPIGPIKWEKNEDGSMTAIAVGTEKGEPRNKRIFTLPNPVNKKVKSGQPIVNTPIDEAELKLTSDGTATQPPDPDPAVVDLDPSPSETPTPSETSKKPAGATTELPIREGKTEEKSAAQDQTNAAVQPTEQKVVDKEIDGKEDPATEGELKEKTVGEPPADAAAK
jgi:hypothetical protein